MDLPEDLVSHKIFSALSITDKIKSILPLNTAGRAHFETYHHDDIKLYTQLLSELITFKSPNDEAFNIIEEITHHLKFSEIFPMTLPMLSRIISQVPATTDRQLILLAMNLHPVNMSELALLSNISFPRHSELDILIFASRALLNYYIPNIPVPLNPQTILSTIQLPGFAETQPLPWFNEEIPWIVNHFDEDKIASYQYWAIYMSYLYETVFDLGCKRANIPSLNCVFKNHRIYDDEDYEKRKNLRELMEYGLIVWSRDNINDLRMRFFNQKTNCHPFATHIFEAHRINRALFANRNKTFVFGIQFMTRFILGIVNEHGVELRVNTSNIFEIKPLTNALALVEEHRFANYRIGDRQSFTDLTKLILKVGDINDNKLLIIGCMSQNEVDKGYINATLEILYMRTPKARGVDIKRFLNRLIIRRSKSYYENLRDLEKAMIEIRKLAEDPLFIADIVSNLARDRDQEYAYLMITELYKLRRDWTFKPGQTQNMSQPDYRTISI